MKLNFKKISAIATGVLMLGMSAGVAAAANYPDPFIVGSNANVALVVGTGDGVSVLDAFQAANIQSNLQTYYSGDDGDTPNTVVGEAYELYTSSKKIWMNESINSVRKSVTSTQLPTILADGDWEGDTSADYTQIIYMGDYSKLDFAQQPTSDDDPVIGFKLATGTLWNNGLYNLSITFDKNVSLVLTDSVGASLDILGRQYKIGAGSTKTNLYLYESSQSVGLSIGGTDPQSQPVTVDGGEYTVTLEWTTDTVATITLTDSEGNSDTKDITEDNSKKLLTIDVAVDSCNEGEQVQSAIITVGANKLKLTDGSKIKKGSDETAIKGTEARIVTGSDWNSLTKLSILVGSEDSDVDSLMSGDSFVDPVFGTLKIAFSATQSNSDRELINISTSSDDKAKIRFSSHDGNTATVDWYNNDSGVAILSDGSDRTKKINLMEMQQINVSDYVVVGNEDTGYLLQLTTCDNDTATADDEIVFTNVMDTSETFTASISGTESQASLDVGGASYTVRYGGGTSDDTCFVRLDYPDSSGGAVSGTTGDAILYPTISTSNGAKIMFYEPYNVSISHWNVSVGNQSSFGGAYSKTTRTEKGGPGYSATTFRIPDGNGYSTVVLTALNATGKHYNVSGTATRIHGDSRYPTAINTSSLTSGIKMKIGPLYWNVSGGGSGNNMTMFTLLSPADGKTGITRPSIVIFEEEDDNNEYQAIVIDMEGVGTNAAGVGVSDAISTYMNDTAGKTYGSTDWDNINLESDNDKYASMDLWGTLMIRDDSDSDQSTLEISYPDEQVAALVYVAEEDASITPGMGGGSGGSLGEIIVKDSEVGSVGSKNLIVVGGSCINTAAATLLGGAHCSADFTEATGVGSGQFLLKGYSDSTLTTKLALLVAGYNVDDTVKGAKFVTTQAFDTSAECIGTSETTCE